jgi:dTDP-4-dehydrorhamnose reductase
MLTMQRLARARRASGGRWSDRSANWARSRLAVARVVAGGSASLAEKGGIYHLSAQTDQLVQVRARRNRRRRAAAGGPDHHRNITPARRPAYGVLATGKFENAFGFALGDWRDALQRCLASQRGAARS